MKNVTSVFEIDSVKAKRTDSDSKVLKHIESEKGVRFDSRSVKRLKEVYLDEIAGIDAETIKETRYTKSQLKRAEELEE